MPLSINQIPIPVPSSTDPANFSARGDAVFGAFPNFITQTNAVASEAAVNRDLAEASKTAAANSETNAATYASNATTSANNASSSSIAPLWVSGTTYAINDKRVSPITGQVYRRKTAGAGTTDPSLDSTNWYAVLLDADTQYPAIKPTLNLDFANSGKLDPRITFTRASTATYFDKLGVLRTALQNESRFDYDPLTLEAKGLLIEEQRTNLLLNSSTLMSVDLNNGVRLANQLVAPDGTLSASVINGVGGASAATWKQSAAATAATMTFSCYLKTGLPSSITSYPFLLRNSTTGINFSVGIFNQTTGAITGTGWSSAHVGNGWYRISYTNQASQVITVGDVITCYFGATGGPTYATSVALGVWGIQLEAGAFPTSYIPTTTTAVTRQADSAVMTGTNFSSWYNQNEGAFYAEAESYSSPNITCICSATDGTLNKRIELWSGQNSHLYVFDSTLQVDLDAGGFIKNIFSKLSGTYKLNDFAVALDSGTVVLDTSGTLPVVNQFRIGVRGDANGNVLNGHIKKLCYYPKRLPNYQLQILTK